MFTVLTNTFWSRLDARYCHRPQLGSQGKTNVCRCLRSVFSCVVVDHVWDVGSDDVDWGGQLNYGVRPPWNGNSTIVCVLAAAFEWPPPLYWSLLLHIAYTWLSEWCWWRIRKIKDTSAKSSRSWSKAIYVLACQSIKELSFLDPSTQPLAEKTLRKEKATIARSTCQEINRS